MAACALVSGTGSLVLAGCGSGQVKNAASTAPSGTGAFTFGDTEMNAAPGAKFVISLTETGESGYQRRSTGGSEAG